MTDTDYTPEFRIPDSFYEESVTLDEEREYAWHELPACDHCRAEGEVQVYAPLGGSDPYGEWAPCPVCKGEGYIDPRSQT